MAGSDADLDTYSEPDAVNWREIRITLITTANGFSWLGLSGLRPRMVFVDVTEKGYLRDSFEDTWRPYLAAPCASRSLPSSDPSRASQGNNDAAASTFSVPSSLIYFSSLIEGAPFLR